MILLEFINKIPKENIIIIAEIIKAIPNYWIPIKVKINSD